MARAGVMGAGSWGTALALLLNKNGHEVTIWSIDKAEVEMLKAKREHVDKLPGIPIPESIKITNNITEGIEGMDIVVLAVPSVFTRSTARAMCPYIKDGQILVNVSKGIEETTLMTMTEQIEEEIPQANVTVLSGPSHAEEVGREIPTTVVVGAKDQKTAEYIQSIFMSRVFRVYTSPDILGIELGGSLKSVIALAAGMADGLGYGDNARASLITRGLAEITRFGVHSGAQEKTFLGLTGVGDLFLTCSSKQSRNYSFGYEVGKANDASVILKNLTKTVEGIPATKIIHEIAAKKGISVPIVDAVYAVIYENQNPRKMAESLMSRSLKAE